MFDLDLIESALDDAVALAEELLERKLQEYAGREDNPHVALYRNAVILEKDARAEFAKLRKAMEGAIERDVIEGNAGAHGFHVVHTPSQWAGHRVLLVKCDE